MHRTINFFNRDLNHQNEDVCNCLMAPSGDFMVDITSGTMSMLLTNNSQLIIIINILFLNRDLNFESR